MLEGAEAPSRQSAAKAALAGDLVGAAHALVALAGMAVAVRGHADALQLALVLRAVVAAGLHGAVNGLIVHVDFLHFNDLSARSARSVRSAAGNMHSLPAGISSAFGAAAP